MIILSGSDVSVNERFLLDFVIIILGLFHVLLPLPASLTAIMQKLRAKLCVLPRACV